MIFTYSLKVLLRNVIIALISQVSELLKILKHLEFLLKQTFKVNVPTHQYSS